MQNDNELSKLVQTAVVWNAKAMFKQEPDESYKECVFRNGFIQGYLAAKRKFEEGQ